MRLVTKFDKGGSLFSTYSPIITTGAPAVPKQQQQAEESKEASKLMDDKMYTELMKGGLINDVNAFVVQMMQYEKQMGMSNMLSGATSSSIRWFGKVNEIRRNHEMYKDAEKAAQTNKALNEVAVGSYGEIFVQTQKGVKAVTTQEYSQNRNKYGSALTVRDLLREREQNPNMAWDTKVFSIASSSVGMEGINKHINDIIKSVQIDTTTSETVMTAKQFQEYTGLRTSQEDLESLVQLKQMLVTGEDFYKVKASKGTADHKINNAINYIWNTLEPSARNKLSAVAALNGTTVQDVMLGATSMLKGDNVEYSGSPIDESTARGGSKGSKESEKPLNAFQMFFHQSLKGLYTDFFSNDPDLGYLFRGTVGSKGPLLDKQDNQIGMTRLSDILIGHQYNNLVDPDSIYMGTNKVETYDQNNIIFDATKEAGIAYMPTLDGKAPDYESLTRFNEANQVFQANSASWSAEYAKQYFAKQGFVVEVEKTPDGLKLKEATAPNANVRPFLILNGVTTDAVEEVVDKNKFVKKMTGYELDQLKPYLTSAWTIGQGKGAKDMTPKNPFLSLKFGTDYYRGVVTIAVKPEAAVIADALVKSGPLTTQPHLVDVQRNITHSTQHMTGGLNPQISSMFVQNNK